MKTELGVRIGEFARQTGLSVRTLHHYDALSLLRPRQRTDSAHRLYTEDDLHRLWQIQALKSLGLSLQQIRSVLDSPQHDPKHTLRQHMAVTEARLHEQAAYLERLRRLEGLARPSWADLLEVIRMNQEQREKIERMMERAREVGADGRASFTPEQIEYLRQRAEAMGQRQWPELVAEVLSEIELGTPPHDPRAKALAERWHAQVGAFTGGRPDIQFTLQRGHDRRMTPEMQAIWDYIQAASQDSGQGD